MEYQDTQKQAFQERLNRLQTIKPVVVEAIETPTTVGTMRRPKPAKPVSVLPDWRENIRYPASFVGAFFIGVFAVFVARYVRFVLGSSDVSGSNADMLMMIDGGVAVTVGLALTMLFRIEGKEKKLAQTAGVVAMVCSMHNLVHAMPRTFSVIFSPRYVEEIIYYTEPRSFLFRGVSFVIGSGETARKPKALPTVLRLTEEPEEPNVVMLPSAIETLEELR